MAAPRLLTQAGRQGLATHDHSKRRMNLSAPPSPHKMGQGRKLTLFVDFNQQALFAEPPEAPPEIGKEHLTRLVRGHLIRQIRDAGFRSDRNNGHL